MSAKCWCSVVFPGWRCQPCYERLRAENARLRAWILEQVQYAEYIEGLRGVTSKTREVIEQGREVLKGVA